MDDYLEELLEQSHLQIQDVVDEDEIDEQALDL